MRSPVLALLWEQWRLTRLEIAWKLAFGIIAPLTVLGLTATFAPTADAARHERIMDDAAAIAMILLVLPHLTGWRSLGRLTGGRPGFPFSLHYTRPVRTVVLVGVPMAYLTAMSWAMYLSSALVLRASSDLAFPLLPVASWIAALNVVFVAGTWSTRQKGVEVLVMMFAVTRALGLAMDRLTAVEIPGSYDWPPRLWPALFDFPRTDYAWIALIGVVSFGVAAVAVARQRRGDDAVVFPAYRPAFRGWLGNILRVPCPTSSAVRAQVWFDVKSGGLPLLTVGVTLAMAIVLVSAVSGPIDAALNASPSVPCPIEECFYVRVWPPLLAPLAFVIVLVLGGNAFGIRRKQGRTSVCTFEVTQAHGAAYLAAVKLFVRWVCVMAALAAIGASVWIALPLLGDGVFIQMWSVPLSSRLSGIAGGLANLAWHEQLALAVVAAVAILIWVASFAVLGALWTRYSRRANLAALSLLLSGVAFALLALAVRNGSVSPEMFERFLSVARWGSFAAMIVTTGYVFWNGFAERVLTVRYAGGAMMIAAVFAAAWLTALQAAGVQLAGMSAATAVSLVSPALLLLMTGVLAPWSLSRVRHM